MEQRVFNPYKAKDKFNSNISFKPGIAEEVEKPSILFSLFQRGKSSSRKSMPYPEKEKSTNKEVAPNEDKSPKKEIRENSVSKKGQASKIEINQKSSLFSSLTGITKISFGRKSNSIDQGIPVVRQNSISDLNTKTLTTEAAGGRKNSISSITGLNTYQPGAIKSLHSRHSSSGAFIEQASMKQMMSSKTKEGEMGGFKPFQFSMPKTEIENMIEKSVGSKYAGIFRKRKNSSRDASDLQSQTYYMKNLEYHLKFENSSEYSKKTKKHLLDMFASIKYVMTVRKPSDDILAKSKFQCAQLSKNAKREKKGR